MKPLPTQFEAKAFSYKQIARNSHAAVYEVKNREHGGITWEVISINSTRPATFIKGGIQINIEAKELYPKDEAWGTSAWAFSKASHSDPLAAAMARFHAL